MELIVAPQNRITIKPVKMTYSATVENACLENQTKKTFAIHVSLITTPNLSLLELSWQTSAILQASTALRTPSPARPSWMQVKSASTTSSCASQTYVQRLTIHVRPAPKIPTATRAYHATLMEIVNLLLNLKAWNACKPVIVRKIMFVYNTNV